MRHMLKEAGNLSDPAEDENFAHYWAAEAIIEPGNDLKELSVARSRFMRRLGACEERQKSWEKALDRARDLNSDQVLDHFAATTGYSVEEVIELSCPNNTGNRSRFDRPSITIPLRSESSLRVTSFSPTIGKIGPKVITSAVSVYLMLIMVGSWEPSMTSDHATKGLPEYSWLELGSRPRGRAIPPDMYISRRYKAAVRTLQRANTSVWGYLPGVKQDLLNEGIIELESAIQFQRNSSYIYPQALMLLADAYIRAGQPAKAVGLVDEIIERRGRRYQEACELRIKLRSMGLY